MDLSTGTKGNIKLTTSIKKTYDYNNIEFDDYSLQLGEQDDEDDYKEGQHSDSKKWGQLKLFSCELLFLTLYSTNNDIVIYVGAAKGTHIYVLAKLFTNIQFHLYDTMPFDKKLSKCSNITLFNNYFTETNIQEYNRMGKNYLFISDIRNLTYDRNKINMRKNQDMIWDDMLLQQEWLTTLKFKYAFLKFRLPYPEEFVLSKYGDTVDYLDGTIFKQPYTSSMSTETRLLVDGSKLKFRKWNLKNYESKMFFHNKVIRQNYNYINIFTNDTTDIYPDKVFKHVKGNFMLNRDYDSLYFSYVLQKYMKNINVANNTTNFKKLCDYIIGNT